MKIEVELRELEKLRMDSEELSALHEGGVDNWEWYSEAMSKLIAKRELKSLIEEYAHEACLIASEYGEQPAGYGCGFGVRKEGEVGVENLLKEFIKDYKEIESE